MAAELRRNPATAALLVAVTGYDTDKDRERARWVGFDCYITKPADPVVILQFLGRPA